MAVKSIFVCETKAPYFKRYDIEFKYNMGLSISQKRKNIHSVHDIYNKTIDSNPVLEISSKSEDEIGVQLSAFNLCKYVPSLKKSISVECIYQAAKIFEHGGPFEDLLLLDSKTAKKDERLKNNGKVAGFRYEGNEFPATPAWAFYNYIYMLALKENEKFSKHLLSFSAFSDIEFSIDSINCQACAAAQYVSLYNQNKLEESLLDFETFLKTCVLDIQLWGGIKNGFKTCDTRFSNIRSFYGFGSVL